MMPRFSPPRYSKNDVLARLSQDILGNDVCKLPDGISCICRLCPRCTAEWLGQARQAPTGPSQALQRVAPSRPFRLWRPSFPARTGKYAQRKSLCVVSGKSPVAPAFRMPNYAHRDAVCVVRCRQTTPAGASSVFAVLQIASAQPPRATAKRCAERHSHQRLFHSRAPTENRVREAVSPLLFEGLPSIVPSLTTSPKRPSASRVTPG